jgi:mRNA interferase RelE/StbE
MTTLNKAAVKYLEKLDVPTKQRIKAALDGLAKEPPEGDIRQLTGQDGYRLRVGDYRILFDMAGTEIIVYNIGPRGQAYKKSNRRKP